MHGARPVSAPRVSALTVASTMPAERSRLVPAESIPQAASAGSAWVGRTVPAIEGTPATAALTEAAIATGTSGSRPVRPRLACQPGAHRPARPFAHATEDDTMGPRTARVSYFLAEWDLRNG